MFKRSFHTLKPLFQATQALPKINLTFFTKENCQLCEEAKIELNKVLKDEKLVPFQKEDKIELKYIDILREENSKWFEMYRYDIPVLHIDRPDANIPMVKFMHRLNTEDLIDELTEEI